MNDAGQNANLSISLIHFDCTCCGQKICISLISAGKTVKCPKCKNIINIPRPSSPLPPSQEDDPIRLKRDSDMPSEPAQPIHTPPQQWSRTGPEPSADVEAYTDKSAPPPEQKPATILNVFAFPFSLAGVLHFILFWFAPVLFTLLSPVAAISSRFGGPYLFLSLVFYGYLFYYLATCVVAAAKDERFAPDISLEDAFTIGDFFRRLFLLFAAAGICFCPMTAYYLYFYFTEGLSRIDTVYWLLFGISVFLFPMFLLAVLMFDSFTAFNPFLIIGSIAGTFLPYCGLAILSCAIGLFMYLSWALPRSWAIISWGVDIYLMFIAAYILGRFFRRYENKLNWEVKL